LEIGKITMHIDESQPIIRLDYKGWKMVAHHQCEIKPFKPYVAILTKDIGDKIIGFNKGGNTLQDAIDKAKQEIERRDGKTQI
jgi:hypothetical protein